MKANLCVLYDFFFFNSSIMSTIYYLKWSKMYSHCIFCGFKGHHKYNNQQLLVFGTALLVAHSVCGDEFRTNPWTPMRISNVNRFDSALLEICQLKVLFGKTYAWSLHLHPVPCLTLFGAVAPAGDPAAVSLGDGL